jgi:hypothetical protein
VAGKHISSAIGVARLFPGDNDRLRRGWTVVGAVLAAAAVVWAVVWVQRTAAHDPQAQMVNPAPAPPAAALVATPSSVPPASAFVSIAPSLVTAHSSPSVTVSPSPTPSVTRSTSVSAAPVHHPATQAASPLSATYAVGSSWDTGFIGGVTLTNSGSTAVAWTVTVSNASTDGVKITDAWNATLTRQGDTDTYTGGPLAAGATASFGFEATKQATGKVKPAACTVNQSACRVS